MGIVKLLESEPSRADRQSTGETARIRDPGIYAATRASAARPTPAAQGSRRARRADLDAPRGLSESVTSSLPESLPVRVPVCPSPCLSESLPVLVASHRRRERPGRGTPRGSTAYTAGGGWGEESRAHFTGGGMASRAGVGTRIERHRRALPAGENTGTAGPAGPAGTGPAGPGNAPGPGPAACSDRGRVPRWFPRTATMPRHRKA
jgi:hypothetical protein